MSQKKPPLVSSSVKMTAKGRKKIINDQDDMQNPLLTLNEGDDRKHQQRSQDGGLSSMDHIQIKNPGQASQAKKGQNINSSPYRNNKAAAKGKNSYTLDDDSDDGELNGGSFMITQI